MKIALPKLPKKISIRTFTSLVLVVVILVEFYLAYSYLYKKLSPQPEPALVTTSIVRINRAALSEITSFLDALSIYQPEPPVLANPNPLQYSQ